MRIGLFADAHDHVDNVRRAVAEFNRNQCDLVLFAGDFVSPIVVPALRKLTCRVIACFGDNEGNRSGIEGGMRIIGGVGAPPLCVRLRDGTRVLLSHIPSSVRDLPGEYDVIVTAHTHRPNITRDQRGRLWINPGETSGWTYRKPTVVLLETDPLDAQVIALPEMPPIELVE